MFDNIKKIFKKKTQTLSIDEEIKRLIKDGYIDENGYPLKCHKCNHTNFETKIIDSLNGTPCEKELICNKCGASVGYWAYGYWQI